MVITERTFMCSVLKRGMWRRIGSGSLGVWDGGGGQEAGEGRVGGRREIINQGWKEHKKVWEH